MTPNWSPCPCGKPWPDLERYDPATVFYLEEQIAKQGEMVTVSMDGTSWRVPRRCIAYHGITSELLRSGCFKQAPPRQQ